MMKYLTSNGLTYVLSLIFGILFFPNSSQAQTYTDCLSNMTYVGGQIYLDYNSNKLWETTGDYSENGAPGVAVYAYGDDGSLLGSTTSDAAGGWAILVGNGTKVRIEFSLPDHFKPSPAGDASKSGIAFSVAPACDINYGVHDPLEYCETDPEIMTICNVKHWAPDTEPQIISLDFSDGGNSTSDINEYLDLDHPVMVGNGATGNLWGLSFNKNTNLLYTSTSYKKNTEVGPNGLGAIYYVDNSANTGVSGSVTTATLLTNLTAGTDPTNGEPWNADAGETYFAAAFDAPAKRGLGGLALNEKGDSLWTVNLFSRKLVGMQLNATGTAVTGTNVEIDMPSPASCSGDEIRPWALKWYRGKFYVGMVCSGEVTQNINNIRAYVYTYTPGDAAMSANPVLEFPLNYNRTTSSWNAPAEWNPWKTVWDVSNPVAATHFNASFQGSYPTPVLADIEFDKGDMIIGVLDRFADQFQSGPDPAGMLNPSGEINVVPAGDLLKAGLNTDGVSWTLEDDAAVTSASKGTYTSGATEAGAGPGGKEFYYDERYASHAETSLGGIANLAGRHEIVAGAYDPTVTHYDATGTPRWGSGGLTWHNNDDGAISKAWEGYYNGSVVGDFGKGNGFGDIEAACLTKPGIQIGNRVWSDDDNNGVQDAGESGLGALAISLYDALGILLATTTSDSEGNYFFSADGDAGQTWVTGGNKIEENTTYYVVFGTGQYSSAKLTMFGNDYYLVSNGMTTASQDATKVDSDATVGASGDPAFVQDMPFATFTTGESGDNKHNFDVGFLPNKRGSIGNTVWIDEDGDGVNEIGEPGIPGVRVQLKDGTGTIIATTETDYNGKYIFDGLLPDDYEVLVDVTTLPTNLTNLTGDPDAMPDSKSARFLSLGEEIQDLAFGYNYKTDAQTNLPAAMQSASFGYKVWNDANGNGFHDQGESGIENVTVNLYEDLNGDGVYSDLVGTQMTNEAGFYNFPTLDAGAYQVVVDEMTLPGNYNTTPSAHPDGLSTNESKPFALAPGDVLLTGNFGYTSTSGSDIGSKVFLDLDDNDLYTAGERGIAGVSIKLKNSGGKVIATAITNSTGDYLFPNLPAGNYTVVVEDTEKVLGKLSLVADPDGTEDLETIVLLDGTNDSLAEDFGFLPAGHTPATDGIIGSTVFIDINDNSAFDTGEGLENVEVELYNAAGTTLLFTTLTDEFGRYLFGGLDPIASYLIRVNTTSLPFGADYENHVDPNTGNDFRSAVDLSSSAGINLSQDFGIKGKPAIMISGLLWEDDNADGIRAMTEMSIFANVEIALLDEDGLQIAQTLTDGTGAYTFENLPNGDYAVQVVDQDHQLLTYWHSSGANSLPSLTDVDATAGSVANVDFGYYQKGAAIGNRIWIDQDADGIQDPEEHGVEQQLVSLTITYANGDKVSMYTETDGRGFYSFDNLMLDEEYTKGDGTDGPTFELALVILGNFAGTVIDANSNSNDMEDSENYAGAVVVPNKGMTKTTILQIASTESAEASYDFGIVFNCTAASAAYGISDGAVSKAGQTTDYFFDGVAQTTPGYTTVMHSSATQEHGIIRVREYCMHNGWRYYYNPMDPEEYLFAVEMGTNVTEIDYIEIRVEETHTDRHVSDSNDGTFVMPRDFFIRTVGGEYFKDLSDAATTINARFYYPQEEFVATLNAAVAVANGWGVNIPDETNFDWFYKSSFDPTTEITATGANITSSSIKTLATAQSAANGTNTADNTAGVGNGLNHIQFDGLSTFSGGTGYITISRSALPVDLISFTATEVNCKIDLNWTVGAADNFSHFEIEQGSSDRAFQSVSQQNIIAGQLEYSLRGLNTTGNKDYFRIKMVDLNGNYQYSELINITNRCNESFGWTLYPNPGKVGMPIQADVEALKGDVTIKVMDGLGQLIYQQAQKIDGGEAAMQINTAHLPAGTYIVILTNDIGKQQIEKLILTN